MDGVNASTFFCSLTGDKEEDKLLLEPHNYLLHKFDKSVVRKTFRALNHWLNIPEDKLVLIDDITRILLGYYMIFDDITDNAVMRKGEPVAHKIYGIGNSINAANYGVCIAWERCFELHPDAPRILLEHFLVTLRGQGIEIYWRDSFTCPTEEMYLEMAKKKTHVSILILKLMQLFSNDKTDYSMVAQKMATFIQIYDDYLSLFSKEYMDEKGFGDDITEGKFGFPIMHFINTYPDDRRVFDILKQRTTDVALKKYLISLLEKNGCRDYTLKKLSAMREEIKEELKRLGGNPFFEDFIRSGRTNMSESSGI